MRTSEYYAQGIYSFFANYGLDAVERHHGVVEAPEETEPEPTPGRLSADAEAGMDFDDYVPESCQCLAVAYPPCSFCEPSDDEGGA